MSVDEIRQGILRVLDTQTRMDRLFERRAAEIEQDADGQCYMTVSATPSFLQEETIFDVHDEAIKYALQRPRVIQGGAPIALGRLTYTLDGLRADDRFGPLGPAGPAASYLELFRSGHIEFGQLMTRRNDYPLFFAPYANMAPITTFMVFVSDIYSRYQPEIPLLIRATFFNAYELTIYVEGGFTREESFLPLSRRTRSGRIEIGALLIEDYGSMPVRATRWIADRIFNAFGFEQANIFDERGYLRRS